MAPWGFRCSSASPWSGLSFGKFFNWSTCFDVIPDANLPVYSVGAECYSASAWWCHSAAWPGIFRQGQCRLVRHLDLSSPILYFLISLVSRSYLTSVLFSWCNFSHSFIFLICSNPGPANLNCRVKIKLLRHNPKTRWISSQSFKPCKFLMNSKKIH